MSPNSGRLDIIVANAGISAPAAWNAITPEAFRDVMDINVTGTWNTVMAGAQTIIDGGRGGSIILIGSAAGVKLQPFMIHYTASKHAVTGMARAFAAELGKHSIRVNSVHPGPVVTEMGCDQPRQLPGDARHGQRDQRDRDGDLTYLYLPLAHSFALLIQFGSFDLGATIAYWERDPLKIMPNMAELHPTYFPSVPRIFEKIHTTATSTMDKEGGLKKAIFNWSIKVGKKMREAERSGKEPGFLLKRQYKFADEKVLSKIRGLFGGNIRLAVSGAAPINPEILSFFDAAGVLVLEGWGMTETSTAATISSPEDFKVGTIGKPFPGCEIKIADDGEILVKGPNVFQGYYKNEEATRETIVDGWLHTGDIGEIDADGFIKITGRKKDIIITAGGKNITPANLENEIKQHPLVSQCVVVGDRRPYLVALVTLDPEEIVAYAKEHGLPEDPQALAANEDIRKAIEAHVETINEKFARVEQVKKIAILPEDLSQENGELTPTLKVKRAVVTAKREPEIEAPTQVEWVAGRVGAPSVGTRSRWSLTSSAGRAPDPSDAQAAYRASPDS